MVTLDKPKGGWKYDTFYLVRVAWNANNPIHNAIFYSGFIQNGEPGASCCLLTPNYEAGRQRIDSGELYYFEVVRELLSSDEWREGNGKLKLPK